MERAQLIADAVTDAEGAPRVRAFVFYPFLADALDIPNAVAAYFPDTRTVYSRFETIEYRYLIHELAHAVCDSRGRVCGEGHGPGFVSVEAELFRIWPNTILVGKAKNAPTTRMAASKPSYSVDRD